MSGRRFAYADPPYLGNGWRNYYGRGFKASEFSKVAAHHLLVERLCTEFPDGWALSASSTSVRALWPAMPEDVRMAVWHRPDGQPFPGARARVIHSWEPVFFRSSSETGPRVRDCLRASSPRNGFPGAKPADFVAWVWCMLGGTNADQLVDLFPGSGAVSYAARQLVLA